MKDAGQECEEYEDGSDMALAPGEFQEESQAV